MQILLRIILAILTPTSDADAEGLHHFAPKEITVQSAYDHVWAARVAAAIYSVDADMVLAISYHESRFTGGVVSSEPGGRVSCGTMTPYPTSTCSKKPLIAQYLDGTAHWAVDWRHAGDVRSEREALLGYAGGYVLIRGCRLGPVIRRNGDDLCRTPDVFGGIRNRIRSARAASRRTSSLRRRGAAKTMASARRARSVRTSEAGSSQCFLPVQKASALGLSLVFDLLLSGKLATLDQGNAFLSAQKASALGLSLVFGLLLAGSLIAPAIQNQRNLPKLPRAHIQRSK